MRPFSHVYFTGCTDPNGDALTACIKEAKRLGKTFLSSHSGSWATKGCYFYTSTSYKGKAYFGTGGELSTLNSGLSGSQTRIKITCRKAFTTKTFF